MNLDSHLIYESYVSRRMDQAEFTKLYGPPNSRKQMEDGSIQIVDKTGRSVSWVTPKTVDNSQFERVYRSGLGFKNVHGQEVYYNIVGGYNRYHREDGPALIHVNGDAEYYINGKPHREDGPAYDYPSHPQDNEYFFESVIIALKYNVPPFS